ncbi:glycosyltransferase family 2 protein [Candidatus Falkowbacteria bacterium]|nr:MAG: glycosyltransferase family 2 protein [Candidatus Falkowbacteria bacterium]
MKVACVIPAYNVKEHLPTVVAELQNLVDEIVVVNDCSTDGTGELATTLPVNLLHHSINRGQGAALKTGTQYALEKGADVIIHFDGDGQFRSEDIPIVLSPLRSDEADIVFGSRFLNKTTDLPFLKRYIIMPLARFINWLFFNITLTDPQSGFRAMNKKAALLINWQQDRMAHCNEILILAHKKPLRIVEVPITVLYKHFGQRFSGGIKILRDLFFAHLNK